MEASPSLEIKLNFWQSLLVVVIYIILLFIFFIYVGLRLLFNRLARHVSYALVYLLCIGIVTIPICRWLLKKFKESNWLDKLFSLNFRDFLIFKRANLFLTCLSYHVILDEAFQTKPEEETEEESIAC